MAEVGMGTHDAVKVRASSRRCRHMQLSMARRGDPEEIRPTLLISVDCSLRACDCAPVTIYRRREGNEKRNVRIKSRKYLIAAGCTHPWVCSRELSLPSVASSSSKSLESSV